MSVWRRLLSAFIVLVMVLPAVNIKAAPSIERPKLSEVENLTAEVKNHHNVYIFEKSEVAVEVDLTGKPDGIVQLRMYNGVDSTYSRCHAYIVREADFGTAVHLTGNLNHSNDSASGSEVQGYAHPYKGYTYWNVALSGGQKYYFVIVGDESQQGAVTELSVDVLFKKTAYKASLGSVALSRSGAVTYDFLSLTNYKREYTFSAKAEEKSVLHFAMDGETAEGKGSGRVDVYDETGALVNRLDVSGSYAGQKNEFSLVIDTKTAHNYVVKASGVYGNISMWLEQAYGSVTVEKGSINGGSCPISVKLDGASARSIQYIKGNYSNEEIQGNTIWNGAAQVNGNTFSVSENGHYILKITLENNQVTYKEFDVSGIDSVAPTISISGYSATAVKFTKSSLDNDVASMTVNGTKIIDGARLAEEGVHTFAIVDTSGNKSEKAVCIDMTAPTFTSDTIKDGGTVENGYHRFSVNDNYSGIKQIKFDGTELAVTNTSISISDSDVRHYIEVIDNCGNSRTVSFKSKRSTSSGGSSGYSDYNSGIVS